MLPIPSEPFATMIIAVVDGLVALQRLDPETAPTELLADTLTNLGEGVATHALQLDEGGPVT